MDVAERVEPTPAALAEGALHQVRGLASPVTLAGDRVLPVLDELAPLFPTSGLRRGSTVAISGRASTSLALAVMAGPSQAGAWCAAVGFPSLGVVAAAEAGVALERLVLVADPGQSEWATVSAALLDALDVVLVRPPGPVRTVEVRRLTARARERGAVLLAMGAWPGPDVRLTGMGGEWEGLGDGHGHLRRRRVDVVSGGRGSAARERRAKVWLPGEKRLGSKP